MALMRNRRSESESEDESIGDEHIIIDHDDKRVLNKRKKRSAGKVEECNIDLENFIKIKKRQKVSEMVAVGSEEDTSVEGAHETNFQVPQD